MRCVAAMRLAIWVAVIVIGPACAGAQSRIALLIGNQGYNPRVGELKNPHNDIALVGGALEKVGFQVTLVKDAGYRAIDTALRLHIQRVRKAGKDAVSFVYYSGHGAANPETRTNYLIPVDVSNAEDDDLWINSFELADIIEKLRSQTPDATHYVVFDACRDELRLTRSGKSVLGSEKGFVAVSNASGVMIAYATAPGRTASDVGSGEGAYARALAEELVKPGIEAVTMFRNVQLRVKRTIGQDPWLSFPTLPAFYFAGEIAPALPPPAIDRPSASLPPARSNPRPPLDAPLRSSQKNQTAWVKLCERAPVTTKDAAGNEQKRDVNICLTHHERLDGNSGMVLVSAAIREVEGQSKQHFMVMVPLGMMQSAGSQSEHLSAGDMGKSTEERKGRRKPAVPAQDEFHAVSRRWMHGRSRG